MGSESGETFTRENPASREPATIAPLSSQADMERAIDAARQVFDSGVWPEASGELRCKSIMKFAHLLEENLDNLASTETHENGKTLKNSRGEIKSAIEYIEFFAGLARNIKGDTISSVTKTFSLILKEPVGVCGFIVPWNSPVDLTVRKLAPALAAGCTVVIKPSSLTPGTILQLGKILDKSDLPKGVVNIVTGAGTTAGEALAKSQKVDKISFTGETATGKRIMSLAAGTVKRISMELGGKTPNIVFEDANLDKVLPAALWAIFRNCGQSCTAGSRLLLQESIHDEFMRGLINMAKKIRIGNPLDPEVEMGPVVSEAQLNKVLQYIESGKGQGARLAYGGERLDHGEYAKGYYVQPTIFDDVSPEMRIAQEEIFGPVLSVLTFTDERDAIEIANSTIYGLASAVWTNNLNRSLRVVRKLRSGDISVNSSLIRLSQAAFGGYKQSGIGRELGERGLEEFLEYKHVSFDLAEEYQRLVR